MLELYKILFIIPFLLYSCYTDLKTRRVPNKVWVVMLLIGSPFILYDLSTYNLSNIYIKVLPPLFIYILVYLLFQLGTIGGADAKALIVISIFMPLFPSLRIMDYVLPLAGIPVFNVFAFSVLGNTVLLSGVVFILLLIYNITNLTLSQVRNPAYLFIGYKMDINKLRGKHVKLIHEYIRDDRGVKSIFKLGGVEVSDDVLLNLQKLREEGLIDEKVWVTPGLPTLVPMSIGFIVAIVYGDLLYLIIKTLLIG